MFIFIEQQRLIRLGGPLQGFLKAAQGDDLGNPAPTGLFGSGGGR